MGIKRKKSGADSRPQRRSQTSQELLGSGWVSQEEQSLGTHPGAVKTRGSGSGWRPDQKGDSVGSVFRAECKTTGKASMNLQRHWLEKIKSEAMATGHQPMLMFGFDGTPREDWIAFPAVVAKNLTVMLDAVRAGDVELAAECARRVKWESE